MKRVIAKASIAVAGAVAVALLAQPGLANAKMTQPPQQIPSDATVLYSLRFDHDLGVAAQNSGIPQALNGADLTTPIPGFQDGLNAAADALNRASATAAAKPGNCQYFGVLLDPADMYFATKHC